MRFADDIRKHIAKRVAGIREDGQQEGKIAVLSELADMAETADNHDLKDTLDQLRYDNGQDNPRQCASPASSGSAPLKGLNAIGSG